MLLCFVFWCGMLWGFDMGVNMFCVLVWYRDLNYYYNEDYRIVCST